MVGVAEEIAARRGLDDVVLEARAELPATLEFWHRRGYREIGRSGSRLTYGRALPASAASESAPTRLVRSAGGSDCSPGGRTCSC